MEKRSRIFKRLWDAIRIVGKPNLSTKKLSPNDTAQVFQDTVNQLIAERGEIVLMFQPIYGGIEDIYLCSNPKPLLERYKSYKGNDSFSAHALRQYDFPVRGTIDEIFLERASAILVTQQEFALLPEDVNGQFGPGISVDNLKEVILVLQEHWGKQAVFGKLPTYTFPAGNQYSAV